MFQFPRFTSVQLCIHYTVHGISHVSSLIRKSPDHWLCAPTRSLSQLITSFIGSWCQGIHHAPFVAWPIFVWLLPSYYFVNCKIYSFMYIVLFISYLFCFLVLSHTKLHIINFFQSFALNITKNISWLTSQYVWSYILSFYMQFSKNNRETWFLKIEQKR